MLHTMARSLSNAKLLSAIVSEKASILVTRRGYVMAAQGVTSGSSVVRGGSVMAAKKVVEDSSKSSPWVPDPVTGYYRPENHSNDVDVAELRELLLNNKITPHQ